MKIVKASAGSGKTYTLANTYIGLLMDSPDRYAYRHILAVTFTNKATAEMKGRILKELHRRAETDPKAKGILTDILHDYSAFSVSTIDRFFQTALKAFSREIGQFSAYQLELDRNSIISEAMDRILDSLTEERKDLVGWIKDSVRDRIEAGDRFRLEDGLYDIGKQLKSEGFRELAEECGIPGDEGFSKEKLARIHSICRSAIRDFRSKAEAFGLKAEPGGGFKVPGKKALAADGDLEALFGKPFDIFNTARLIDSQTYNLGLAGEFLREFDILLKEKNLMCLDESNTLLRDIIDGSDAPFIYEKLGVRYEHFLLDEFQDTSNIQWENFLPLLRESEAGGGRSLIVGDVKQSIYRWRGSDWQLLGSKVAREFPKEPPVALDSNWRSCRAIVEFNNDFFTYAADTIGVSDIYSDVRQKVRASDPQEGFVRISFTDDQQQAVTDSIADARAAGAGWGDIAVLVRNNRDGAALAAALIERGIPVISDDSLRLKSSTVVRRLVSLLSSFDNPEDSIGTFLASSLEIVWPERFFSLTDLCEELLRQLKACDEETFGGETLFIQAFMDDLQTWTETNGNDLTQYLKHWKDSELYISSPDNADSVRIMTIHKSKGLEFPYLIFPYAEKVDMYKHGVHWCRLDTAGTGLDATLEGIYPIDLTSVTERSMFAADYGSEYRMQQVDNLNVFYVALTRAAKCLHVIAACPGKGCQEAIRKGHPDYKDFSQILFAYTGSSFDRSYGTMYDFSKMEREEKASGLDFPAIYESIPLSDRLLPSTDAMDFFGEEGVTGSEASPRLEGIVLHGILSEVKTAEDLRGAVERAVRDGLLTSEKGKEAYSLLSGRMAAHPEWFGASVTASVNEVTIIGDDGESYLPDRVVCSGDGITVIDYKFGEHRKSYEYQVKGYMRLYEKMGKGPVRGAIWYVREDSVTEL